MIAMVRDDFTCWRCGETAFWKLTTHHIVPINEGGQDVAENLITLCEDCHAQVHGIKGGVRLLQQALADTPAFQHLRVMAA